MLSMEAMQLTTPSSDGRDAKDGWLPHTFAHHHTCEALQTGNTITFLTHHGADYPHSDEPPTIPPVSILAGVSRILGLANKPTGPLNRLEAWLVSGLRAGMSVERQRHNIARALFHLQVTNQDNPPPSSPLALPRAGPLQPDQDADFGVTWPSCEVALAAGFWFPWSASVMHDALEHAFEERRIPPTLLGLMVRLASLRPYMFSKKQQCLFYPPDDHLLGSAQ